MLLLLSHLSISAWADKPPAHCWFDTTVDTLVEYGDTPVDNSFCPARLDPYQSHLGTMETDGGRPECCYLSLRGTDDYLSDARWLNTSFEKLEAIIVNEGKNGLLHETMDHFVARFPSCNKSNQGRSLVSDETSAPSYSQQEICLKIGKNKNNKKAVIIGYWLSNVGQCKTFENSPFYEAPQAKPEAVKAASGGCPEYDPDTEFSCDGYSFHRRGWAQECASLLGAKKCYGSTTCKKTDSHQKCCKFAHKKDCEVVSMDTKGHCCCGAQLNKDTDKCRNTGLRRN